MCLPRGLLSEKAVPSKFVRCCQWWLLPVVALKEREGSVWKTTCYSLLIYGNYFTHLGFFEYRDIVTILPRHIRHDNLVCKPVAVWRLWMLCLWFGYGWRRISKDDKRDKFLLKKIDEYSDHDKNSISTQEWFKLFEQLFPARLFILTMILLGLRSGACTGSSPNDVNYNW